MAFPAAAQAPRHFFDIPAQSAVTSLQAFARQTGRQVLFPYDAAADKRAPAVRGMLDDRQVLQLLADAAGLVVNSVSGTITTLRARARDAPVAPPLPPPAAIAEIVVTANREVSVASKTPAAVSAVPGPVLAARGITNPTRLGDIAPNVAINRGNAGGLQINIRGVTSTGTAAPSVAFLLDGIYVADANAQEVSFYDLRRIEVLRGPQGTLYGRNTTAGVINVISNAPTRDFGGSVSTSVSNYGTRQLTGVLNVPLAAAAAIRVAANYDRRRSYYRQAVPQATPQPLDKNNRSIRLTGTIDPSSDLRTLIRADYTAIRGTGNGFAGTPPISGSYATPLAVPPPGMREPDPAYLGNPTRTILAKTYPDAQSARVRDSSWGIMSEHDLRLGETARLTVLQGYREFRRQERGSLFWGTSYAVLGPVDTVRQASTSYATQTASVEARLAVEQGSARFQGGVYLYRLRGRANLWFDASGLETPFTDQRSLAGFGQATIAPLPGWRLTAGVRYTRDDLRNVSRTQLRVGAEVRILSDYLRRGHSARTTWKLGTELDLGRASLLYASVATGYKALGFNGNCSTAETNCAYRPENLRAWEAGLKGRWFDGALAINAAAFHYDYADLQISQIVPRVQGGVTVPSTRTTNAAAARIDGAEIEAAVVPISKGQLELSGTWLRARYTDYVLRPGDPASGTFNGAPLDRSPRFTLSAGYSQVLAVGPAATLTATARTRYSAAYAMISTVINAQFRQPAFTRSDLSLTYARKNSDWFVEAFVWNVENTAEVVYVNTAPSFPALNNGTLTTGDPRTYGVRLGWTF